VRFGLIGPLAVVADTGDEVHVAAPRQRVLLAALLLQANQPVSGDSLAEAVWDQAPPPGYATTLRSYVLRLRHALGPEAAARLVTRSPGYLLQVCEDELDVSRFEALCGRTRTALHTGAWAEASATASQALALWRAAPLTDVPSQLLRAAWLPRLEELRLQAFEGRVEAEIQLGHHEPLLPELRELTAQYALRENLHAALVRALAGAGQRAQALAAYQQARRVLVDELGIEPGPKLRAAQQQALATDREPTPVGAAGAAGDTAPAVRPLAPARQLPPAIRQFAGRTQELAVLSALADQAASGNAAVVCAISGTAGVGKTALAVHWAHQVADRFPDGQLYVNLHGFAPDRRPVAPTEAVRGFLDALGVIPTRIPSDLDAQTALYRTLIASRRILIVLDNARDAGQIRPLLPGSPTVAVLVTSRNQLNSLAAVDGARILALDLLTVTEARELLAARIGAGRVAAEPEAAQRIITASARLPIALAIVAARAEANPQFTLADVARELDQARRNLDVFDGGDPAADVRAVFSWSYATLSPPAARLFRLIGLHPGPDLSAPAAASLAASTPAQVQPLLTELTRINLIAEHASRRYTLHDLLRTYAIHLAHTTDPDQQRDAATQRILGHYLHSAFAADRLLDKGRDPIVLTPPPAGVTPERPTDHRHALDWFTAEHPALLATVDLAAAAGMDAHAWQLAWTLWTFLDWQGHWHDHAAVGRTAVAAAARLTDPDAQGLAHRQLARAYTRLGRFDDAHVLFSRALDLYAAVGDQAGQANTHNNIAILWERRGEPARGLEHARQAFDLFRDAGHLIGQAKALNNTGWFQALLGDYQEALASCQEALTLHRGLGNQYGQAGTLDSLGFVHHQLGHYTEALACYRGALSLHRELGDRYYEADSLARLGDTHGASGNPDAAGLAFQQALNILTELDHPDADKVKAKLGILHGAPLPITAVPGPLSQSSDQRLRTPR
jgi:DNA-binding SARP family transcriptional activator/Tfp pilus assembly protein PilF